MIINPQNVSVTAVKNVDQEAFDALVAMKRNASLIALIAVSRDVYSEPHHAVFGEESEPITLPYTYSDAVYTVAWLGDIKDAPKVFQPIVAKKAAKKSTVKKAKAK